MTPAHLHLLLGQIRPGADPEQDHNRSMSGPFPKDFFLRVGRLQQQTECIAMMMINDLKAFGKKSCYFWFHSDIKVLTWFGVVYWT